VLPADRPLVGGISFAHLTAPLFTLLATALMLRNPERLTWRIVVGAVAITAGVIVL
jgi:drug/metabolite transporter (DMT)-like permease